MNAARRPLFALVLCAVVSLVLAACSGSDEPGRGASPCGDGITRGACVAPTEAPASPDEFLRGTPQQRAGIGDVPRVFERYADTRAQMIDLFKDQGWFKDGLTRAESLFVERSLTFVASYSNGGRRIYVSDDTIKNELYKYERVPVAKGEIELLLIYEGNQNAEREMQFLRAAIPALEGIVGVQYPSMVMTVVNGNFEINDYNDGQFIRIARCCTQSAFVLAHELAHTYWSMGPGWYNEGMADIYATLVQDKLRESPPEGWRARDMGVDIETFHRERKRDVDSGRYPSLTLSRRLASDGLYQVASVFLLDIRKVMGVEAFTRAAHDIYLASDYGRINLREKRIEDIFLKHTKQDGRDEVMSLFNRSVWGDNGERYQRLRELDGDE